MKKLVDEKVCTRDECCANYFADCDCCVLCQVDYTEVNKKVRIMVDDSEEGYAGVSGGR